MKLLAWDRMGEALQQAAHNAGSGYCEGRVASSGGVWATGSPADQIVGSRCSSWEARRSWQA